MRQRVRRAAIVLGTAAALGAGAWDAPQAEAACGIDPGISVSQNGDGSYYVRGGGNAYCSPPVSVNYLSVAVHPTNAVINALASNWSHSASNSCNNGACSITPLSWGYTAPANALAELVNGNAAMCFTASYTALSGGTASRQACG